MPRTKKVYTAKQQAKRLKDYLKRLESSHKLRGKMRRNGLVQPPIEPMTRKQVNELQQKWYAKLAAEEAKKDPEDPTKFVDIEYLPNPESPHMAKPSSRGRRYDNTKQIYYALARNFLTHFRFRHKQQKVAWQMHTEGKSYRKILNELKKQFKCDKSVYWVFYYVQDLQKKCLEWNKTSPEGMLNPANYDSFADDALLGNWSLQLDMGYWQTFKWKN